MTVLSFRPSDNEYLLTLTEKNIHRFIDIILLFFWGGAPQFLRVKSRKGLLRVPLEAFVSVTLHKVKKKIRNKERNHDNIYLWASPKTKVDYRRDA